MANELLLFSGASAGLDFLSGLFGFFASQEGAAIAASRGRMIRLEAEDEAQRYSEQVTQFKSEQKLAFLKSGFGLSGSPLDILDETTRIAEENISAIRARGRAGQLTQEARAFRSRAAGRGAILAGVTRGLGKIFEAKFTQDAIARGVGA